MSNTRSKKAKEPKNVAQTKKFSQKKLFFINETVINDANNENLDIISLQNPATNQLTQYLIAPAKNEVFEIVKFSENHRSWFLNKTVCSDGRIYLVTPMDPLFLTLSYIYNNCQNRAVPLEQLFKDEKYPEISRIIKIVAKEQWKLICDCKPFDDSFALKYNEEKTLKWLKRKCVKLIVGLKTFRIHVGQGAVSSTYIKSEKLESVMDSREYDKYAHGMISDYLHVDLVVKLQKFMKIPEESIMAAKKRKSVTDMESKTIKKNKLDISAIKENVLIDPDDESEEKSKIKENSFTEKHTSVEKKISSKDKALAKAASGTKSIASFFTKK